MGGIAGSFLWKPYTGWTLQIVATFKITSQLNYKTYRKSEDGFGIVGKRATKHYFKTYDLGPYLDPFKRDLEQYGVLQACRTYSSLTHWNPVWPIA